MRNEFYLSVPFNSDLFFYIDVISIGYIAWNLDIAREIGIAEDFFYVEKGLSSHSLPKFDRFIAMIAMHKAKKKFCPYLHIQLLGKIHALLQGFWLHVMYIYINLNLIIAKIYELYVWLI